MGASVWAYKCCRGCVAFDSLAASSAMISAASGFCIYFLTAPLPSAVERKVSCGVFKAMPQHFFARNFTLKFQANNCSRKWFSR